MSRLFSLADATSQWVQVAFAPRSQDSNANESLSGRSYREKWKIRFLIDFICFWEKDHCKKSYYKDLERAEQYIRRHKECLDQLES